jgi:drug/metabolite transporter (DMT)-like permease
MSPVNKHSIENQPTSTHALAAFGLLFGAVCWGIIWFPYRLLSEAGISGVVSSFYTYGIAIIIAGIYFFKYWREIFNLPVSIVWLGMIAGWTNLSYVLAVIDGEVMRVMLLFYLSPLWTLILAHFWLKEKTTFNGYIAIAASLLGAFIMLHNPQLSDFPLPRNTPEWLALSSGIGFSLTNVITRKSTHLSLRAKSFAVWMGVLTVSLLFMLVESSALPSPDTLNTTHWLLLLLVAILLMAATLFVQYGVSRIPATRASVLFLFELVVAAVASYYLAHETMSVNEWIGGGLIVVAAIFAATHEK